MGDVGQLFELIDSIYERRECYLSSNIQSTLKSILIRKTGSWLNDVNNSWVGITPQGNFIFGYVDKSDVEYYNRHNGVKFITRFMLGCIRSNIPYIMSLHETRLTFNGLSIVI